MTTPVKDMDTIINAKGLVKRFGKTTAVDGIDLAVPQHSIFGLVGPDGAGKTTLIRLLVGAMLPQEGSASVCGEDVIHDPDAAKRSIGYLSQQFSLYRDLSVIENIRFFRDIHKVPKDEADQRIEKLLDFSRLGPFVDRPAGKLSGGMRQKLGLCCALIHTPKLLFLDEPTTGVDPVSRRELWALLYDLWHDGMSIVVSTPYMDEAERCTEVAFVSGGKIIAQNTPNILTQDYPYEIAYVTTPRARAIREKFEDVPGLKGVHQHGEHVQILLDSYASAKARISEIIAREVPGADLRQVKPSLEDVFLKFEERQG